MFYDQPAGLTGAVAESWDAVREGVIAGATRSGRRPTMVCSTLPELLDDEAAWQCVQAGIPAVAGLRTGLRCAAARCACARATRSGCARSRAAAAARRRAGTPSAEWLSEHEAKELLRAAGVDVVEGRVVADERRCRGCAAASSAGPIALS